VFCIFSSLFYGFDIKFTVFYIFHFFLNSVYTRRFFPLGLFDKMLWFEILSVAGCCFMKPVHCMLQVKRPYFSIALTFQSLTLCLLLIW